MTTPTTTNAAVATQPAETKTQHTPGPWLNGGSAKDGEFTNWFVSAPPNCIAVCPERDGSSEANARLIAAAPELLAACREVAEWHDLVKQNYPDMAGLLRGLEAGAKAIAKAEGRAEA